MSLLTFFIAPVKSQGSDLTAGEKNSLGALVDKIKAQNLKDREASLEAQQLGYSIVYLAQNEKSGPNVQALFDEITTKIGDIRVSSLIAFPDELEKKMGKLYQKGTTEYPSHVVSDGDLIHLLKYDRPFSNLVEIAKSKIHEKTGFAFTKSKIIMGDQ